MINNLETGGAETMLLRLMEHVDRDRFEPVVVTLIDSGDLVKQFNELGIEVHALGATPGRLSPAVLLRLSKVIRGIRPHIIQSWLYHSNLATFLALALSRKRIPICWNIRHSVDDIRNEPWLTRQVIRAGARFSRKASAVVFNSARSLGQHEALGFSAPRQTVIPNGFDLEDFKPVSNARQELLESLEISDSAFLVGLAGRLHPMKNHEGLAGVVSDLVAEGIDVHLLFAGRGCEEDGSLGGLAKFAGLQGRLHLLGERRPLAPFLSSLDCLVVASLWGEAFPNVLAEAMACATPCVTTDVGDAGAIIDDTQRMCRPGDPEALKSVLRRVLLMAPEERASLAASGRERISREYDVRSITRDYEQLWTELFRASN